MTARALVFQCGACRSLVSVHAAVIDKSQDRAGLPCEVCGGVTWLPVAAAAGSHVVDVTAGSAEVAPLQLGASSALAPTASPAAVTPGFNVEARERIGHRLQKLGASGPAQEDLSRSFERLLGHWHSESEHKQLLQKASLVDELAFIGQRYRAVLAEEPGDAAAKKAQNELIGLAMASMSHVRDDGATGSGGRNRNILAAAILIVTMIICGALVIYLPRLLRVDAGDESMEPAPGADAPAEPHVLEER